MVSRTEVAAAAALLCVFACLTSVVGMTEEQVALKKQLRDMCVEEAGVDVGVLEAAGTGTFADDPKLKCYMKCTFEQIAVIDDDGVIDGDAMIAMLPDELADSVPPVIRKCEGVKGADACDAAFQFNKCMYDAAPSQFMLI